MKRRGSAVMTAMILCSVFFIAVSALLRHSSGEIRHVRAVSAVKKAEMLAMSGIDWAESELRVGRWYGKDFVPYQKNIGKHSTCGIKKLTPFGSDEGTVKVVCEDVANKTPGANMHGMQELWLLHHINVYALGEYENQKCLIYGRYIISPEPILNSKSTDGADIASPENGVPGAVAVPVPKTNVGGEEVTEYVIKEIKVSEYDNIDANSVIAVLNPINDSGKDIEVRPHTFGSVAEIKIQEGKTCRAGDKLLILTKSFGSGSGISLKTLKKMVRVTKIPLEVWKNLDIENVNDRYALSQYISGISGSFLQNFVAHNSLEKALKNIGKEKFDKKMNASRVLDVFPAHITTTTRNRAENMFLAHMIKNFTVPGTTWEKKEKSLDKTFLKLDHSKNTRPPQELVNWLSELNLQHLLNTKPRLDTRYFDPKMKQGEFLDLLRPHLNLPTEEFIKSLSQLEDASRLIQITEGDFGPSSKYSEDKNSIEIIRPDNRVKINVEKITKGYSFVDPESGFTIEMKDLMAFLKKYYDDENCQSPREKIRTNEHIDWPLPAPAPPPPAPIPGGTWVWNEGVPGVPPGKPTYDHVGGTVRNIDPPTSAVTGYEPDSGSPDGGIKEWQVPGIPPTDGSESDKNGESSSIKLCDCNGSNCSICNPEAREKISMNENTTWKVNGKPGVDPKQGSYTWRADPPVTPGSDGEPASGGSGSGGGNGADNASDGNSGSNSSPGSWSGSPSGNPGGGTPSSPPPPPPRSVSGAC